MLTFYRGTKQYTTTSFTTTLLDEEIGSKWHASTGRYDTSIGGSSTVHSRWMIVGMYIPRVESVVEPFRARMALFEQRQSRSMRKFSRQIT